MPVEDNCEFYFDKDVLTYSFKVDRARGKVYYAGTTLGVKPGYVAVHDMETGEIEVVPANASGTRPLNESHPKV